MTQHTQGPWEARSDRTVAAAGVPLLRCYVGRNEEANARLVAAAPGTLAAAREARDFLRAYFGPVSSDDPAGWSDADARTVHNQLDAAIAQATGGEA